MITNKHLRNYFLILFIESFVSMVPLFIIPTDPKNAWLFGYSLKRIIMIGGTFLLSSFTFWFAFNSRRSSYFVKNIRNNLRNWLNNRDFLFFSIFLTIVIIIVSLYFIFRLIFIQDPSLRAPLIRLSSLLFFGIVFGFQTLVLFSFEKRIWIKFWQGWKNEGIPSMHHSNLKFGVFLICFLSISTYLPVMISEAKAADEKINHTIRDHVDDIRYQVIAVNILNGLGPSPSVVLPVESYNLTEEYNEYYLEVGLDELEYSFIHPPGFPFLTAIAYKFFGNQTIVARVMKAVLGWLTAVLILGVGTYVAGWLGAISGWITALNILNYFPQIRDYKKLFTETPAGFIVAIFVFLFVLYLDKKKLILLVFASLSLIYLAFIRANFLVAIPILLIYLYYHKYRLRDILIMGLILTIPIITWTTYASNVSGEFVFMGNIGEFIFPQCNNMSVLEGIGPNKCYQGMWNPGWQIIDDDKCTERLTYSNSTAPKPGENGWIKGLTFWKDNLTQLPRLFYVKLRAGFWYGNNIQLTKIFPVNFYLLGIGYLLFAIGFRFPNNSRQYITKIKLQHVFRIQMGLLVILYLFWDVGMWAVLVVWFLIAILAIIFPYGECYSPPFILPTWFLAFIASHFFTTIIFVGVRYHRPLDGPLLLISVLGIMITLYELANKGLALTQKEVIL